MMMGRTRIKICGVRDVEAARACVDAGTDAVGLVFAEASPRRVDIPTAARIVATLPPFVEPVGLFVDVPVSVIQMTCQSTGIRTVQLHGQETPDILGGLNGLRVIKAIPFDENAAGQAAQWSTDSRVQALLFDAPPPTDSPQTGGHGSAIDWHALAHLMPTLYRPVILAGGLTPGNVSQAVAAVKPFAVDVSSGVESQRGVKDKHLIGRFCAAVDSGD